MYRALWFFLLGVLICSIYSVVSLTTALTAIKSEKAKLETRLREEEEFSKKICEESALKTRRLIAVELKLNGLRMQANEALTAISEDFGPL